MAPVLKRFRIASIGSTSSIATGARPDLSSMSPRSVQRFLDWSSMRREYCLNTP